MKKMYLLAQLLVTTSIANAQNSAFQEMMATRIQLLTELQDPTTPDPFTNTVPSTIQPPAAPEEQLSTLVTEETELNQELTKLMQELAVITQSEQVP